MINSLLEQTTFFSFFGPVVAIPMRWITHIELSRASPFVSRWNCPEICLRHVASHWAVNFNGFINKICISNCLSCSISHRCLWWTKTTRCSANCWRSTRQSTNSAASRSSVGRVPCPAVGRAASNSLRRWWAPPPWPLWRPCRTERTRKWKATTAIRTQRTRK